MVEMEGGTEGNLNKCFAVWAVQMNLRVMLDLGRDTHCLLSMFTGLPPYYYHPISTPVNTPPLGCKLTFEETPSRSLSMARRQSGEKRSPCARRWPMRTRQRPHLPL